MEAANSNPNETKTQETKIPETKTHETKTSHPSEAKKGSNKTLMMAVGVILIIAIISVVYLAIGANGTSAQIGDNVSIIYTGKFTNGTVFDTNVGKTPFQFTIGANEVIPGFEDAIIGMKINQTKNVVLSENEAYGPINPELIESVPVSKFGNQSVQVGMIFTQTIVGHQIQGVVTSVNSTNVTLDFNPPLAGQTLEFNITVVGITKK